MSESQSEDAKRRERARRVDALTDAARQPGEGPRLGTRIAGAIAVLALVAGATLGIGAWNSYKTEQAAKEKKAAAAWKKRKAAARKSALKSPSASPSPSGSKKSKKSERLTTAKQHADDGGSTAKATKVEKPDTTVKKRKPKVQLNSKLRISGAGYSRVVLVNQDSKQCADIPNFGPQRDGVPINQYPCNASDGDNQQWNITVSHPHAGAEGGDLVMLANAKDGHCFDLPDGDGKPAGTRLHTANCNGRMDDNQQWRIETLPNGQKKIHNFASRGKCLQVEGNSHTNDAPLIIGSCQAPSSNWLLRK
ncbi:RICIN domain-containing protein [Streptomyces sp. 891-h]|uniref:RICIN domain-containing protein n=1 Tax=unclassified Streptomyces TaxID=2593676 RepID=UPI001FAB330B|nr:RICIN domain-containing protein [Streptomyces sp. 891-h]UNZ16699.1 RICIN domain-containing protein [Streptomyces sp. 891-h]